MKTTMIKVNPPPPPPPLATFHIVDMTPHEFGVLNSAILYSISFCSQEIAKNEKLEQGITSQYYRDKKKEFQKLFDEVSKVTQM